MADNGNAKNVKHGPGWLYLAPVGFSEAAITAPTVNLKTILALVPVGYTEEGSSVSIAPSFENIEVAEELDPIDVVPTGRETTVGWACAEVTARNISLAFNGGVIETAAGHVTFEPPASDDEAVHTAIVWQSFKKDEIWVYRDCVQTGSATLDRRKGTQKTTIPLEFRVLKPSDGRKGLKAWLSTPTP